MHDSLTIALLQAREAAMTYFRPIVKSHNLTDQQWRIVRILADSPSMDFHDLAFRTCILRPSLTGNIDAHGAGRAGVATKAG
ncbi:homoprotocatechuate degradative operon repressor [Salmonella enterica subsp. arizonae]|uniref:Homoprotocatechuate degradative operon repressor n=1 Tax=Salmonella enterica subsp. arizonae TaxID=59203 RepID=A0A379SH08_SALER|nr:homoprotocatechuate degradative operon repressor [Salmonella enterica subsp. arizonae]